MPQGKQMLRRRRPRTSCRIGQPSGKCPPEPVLERRLLLSTGSWSIALANPHIGPAGCGRSSRHSDARFSYSGAGVPCQLRLPPPANKLSSMIQSLRLPVCPQHPPLSEPLHSDVRRGLRQTPKQLPSKYFYDQRGSQLFDQICELDDYYLTRAELQIMQRYAAEMVSCLPADGVLIEFGSGSSIKTRQLLDRLCDLQAYVPIDISGEHLLATAQQLQQRYHRLKVLPLVADFTTEVKLPPLPEDSPRTLYFPGSTIGNFEPPDACQLLRHAASLVGDGGRLLIGIDLQKDPAVIQAAYNDVQGITAEFNLNLLRRINRELGADFRLEHFEHEAPYDALAGRVEMRLRCTSAQTVHLAGERFSIQRAEAIRTEYSHKYTVAGFTELAQEAGFVCDRQWLDDRQYFAVLLLQKRRS